MTHYTFTPAPVKAWLYPPDAEKRPRQHLIARWQPYEWETPAKNLAAAERADWELMSHCQRLRSNFVRMPLRIAGIDCGGKQP